MSAHTINAKPLLAVLRPSLSGSIALLAPLLDLPHRINYDLMPAFTALFMYSILTLFAAVFLYGVYRRLRIYFKGTPPPRFDHFKKRAVKAIVNAFLQRRVLKKKYPGIMHLLIYSGIVILLIGTTLVFIDSDIWETLLHSQILVGNFYLFFELFLDAFGLVAIAGLIIAIFRRTISRPPNLPTSRDDVYIFSALLVILTTGYILEAIRLAVDKPPWEQWSFVGYQLSLLLISHGLDTQGMVSYYRGLWWFHALLAFTAVASIPYTKLFHLITSPLNALFGHLRPKGRLSAPFDLKELLASGNFDVKVGAAAIADFSWQQRLTFDSCTSCGRCTNSCPATAAGTPLSPMHLILKLRNVMLRQKATDGGQLVVPDIVNPEELWACTTCRACVNECPVLIDHVDAIVDMRRHLVGEGKLDRGKRDLLTNLSNVSNPYGLLPADRMKWAEGLDVKTVKEQPGFDLLYWVGCSGSYDPRNQNVSRALVKILKAAGIRFSVLGSEEKCNCEVARRLGEEGRFQQAATELADLFKKYNVKTILTQCPHCFNTFKNEYAQFGADLQVMHHSQLIAQLIAQGKLKLKKSFQGNATFHDPCYLGRYNDVYDSPREILTALSHEAVKEMPRSRENSFCCGAGGANFWYKVEQKKKIGVIRFEEAQKTNANILATACPFCTSMLEDASVAIGAKELVAVRDIAELVAGQIESS
jgi:Fe-S oxidoreductase/nitrate reductase gamma subunit